MAELVSVKEIQQLLGLKKLGFVGNWLAKGLMKLTKMDQNNAIYDRYHPLPSKEFLDTLPPAFNAKYEIHENDLKRIPKDGAFITVSNHPTGPLDGILLMKILTDIRPEFKMMSNFLVSRIENLRPFLLPVNPFEDHKDKKSSLEGIKLALKQLQEGNPIGIFPAGEVSTYDKEKKIITDSEWQKVAIRIIQKAGVPVIPIYFHAKNSPLFYRLSSISGVLRTASLPRELVNPNKSEIKIRIGRPIMPKEIKEFENTQELSDFLRKKTYMLANVYNDEEETKKSIIKRPKFRKKSIINCPTSTPKPIIEESPIANILKEIEQLRKDKELLFENGGNYEVFFTPSHKIPTILTEIGRLREITFRAVGEGTNQEIDLDKYDEYYHHLFLWNNKEQKIAGAYRMGLGREIYAKYGVEGFYTSELFKFDEDIHFFLPGTIEMGRAFVTLDYQQKPMPLFLLWRGIVYITLKYPEYRFLMGGVSISNRFSDFSKSVMIEFMKSHYYDASIAQYIQPKNEYKVKLNNEDKQFILGEIESDLNKFDRLIDEIEPGDLRFPVLLKKYIKQNARIISFNVDPKFNDAIDGLMYIRIAELPDSTVQPIIEEIEKKTKM